LKRPLAPRAPDNFSLLPVACPPKTVLGPLERTAKNRSGGTERAMAKRKSGATSPSGQKNPGRKLVKPETLPTKTAKAKPNPILCPLLCIGPTVETKLAKTGLEFGSSSSTCTRKKPWGY